jgi:ribose 5-phosphate isomerase A
MSIDMQSATDENARRTAKLRAAEWDTTQIKDGMAVGLGTGTTSALVIDAVGKRVAAGLRITAIATSEESQRHALALGIPMSDFAHLPALDLTIDGADEVQEGSLNLIKGHGGALLREKIVASASARLLIAVDPSKLVTQLGSLFTVPVEVVPFGWETTAVRLHNFAPELRIQENGHPYLTDGNHFILHCNIADSGFTPKQAAEIFKATLGVVEHGLFLDMASKVVIGGSDGIRILEKTP